MAKKVIAASATSRQSDPSKNAVETAIARSKKKHHGTWESAGVSGRRWSSRPKEDRSR